MAADPSSFFNALSGSTPPADRPLVVLAWAQTLDGSVAWPDGSPLTISSPASFHFTHRLRAFCDAIIVGIGTVLADDPRLTARDAPGEQPRPIVLDTHLRLPPRARLFDHPRSPWLLAGPDPDAERQQQLGQRGAVILTVPLAGDGRIDLLAALRILRQRGIRTLMVEGGPTVHAAFLQEGLADWLAVTLGPQLLGGLPALRPAASPRHPIPALDAWHLAEVGPDLLIWGRLRST